MTSLYIEPTQLSAIQKIAAAKGLKGSGLIRMLIADYIRANRKLLSEQG